MRERPLFQLPVLHSRALVLFLFLSFLFPSRGSVSPPQRRGPPQLQLLPSPSSSSSSSPSPSPLPSPATTAPPSYPRELNLLRPRQGQGQSQIPATGCPSGQVTCGKGCAYDCCDGQAGANGWACRSSGEKCFTKGGYVGCCKGRDCPQKRRCYNYPPNLSCDASTGSCIACTDSAVGYCVTETNPAVGLSVLYCAASSQPLSFVTGTALRPLASAESGPTLGQGILVSNSLSSPGGSPTMSGSVSVSVSGPGSGGLSKGDVAGITIGTVAVVSLIVFGAAFLLLRYRKIAAGKLAAGATSTEAPAVTPRGDHPPPSGLGGNFRPDGPVWPGQVDQNYELAHWIPQELDGGEIVVRKQDAQGREPESGSSLVSPIKDNDEVLGEGRHPK